MCWDLDEHISIWQVKRVIANLWWEEDRHWGWSNSSCHIGCLVVIAIICENNLLRYIHAILAAAIQYWSQYSGLHLSFSLAFAIWVRVCISEITLPWRWKWCWCWDCGQSFVEFASAHFELSDRQWNGWEEERERRGERKGRRKEKRGKKDRFWTV